MTPPAPPPKSKPLYFSPGKNPTKNPSTCMHSNTWKSQSSSTIICSTLVAIKETLVAIFPSLTNYTWRNHLIRGKDQRKSWEKLVTIHAVWAKDLRYQVYSSVGCGWWQYFSQRPTDVAVTFCTNMQFSPKPLKIAKNFFLQIKTNNTDTNHKKKIAELWPAILELYGYHWKMAFLCSEHTSFSGFSDR